MQSPATRKRYLQLGLVFISMILVRFGWMFALGRTLYFGDNYSLLVPAKIFTAHWLSQGILPLWNPYIFSGISWIGDITQSIFYPSTLLFILFNPATALNLTVVAQLAVALVGMYGLAYAWTKHHWPSVIAAVLWTFSTQVTGSINNLATIQSIVWIPWLAWMALYVGKKWWGTLVFAVVVTAQMLAGYPQHAFYGIILAVIISLHKAWGELSFIDWLKAWIITGIASVALSAIAWMPFIEPLLNSTRMLQTTTQASRGSLDPTMLLKAGLPYVFDKSTAGMKWGPAWSGHPNVLFYLTWIGGIIVVVSLLNTAKEVITRPFKTWWYERETKDRVFLSVLVVGSLVFAMGSYVPGFALLQELIPFFRVSRYPSMVIMLTNMLLALWVAIELPNCKITKKWQRILFSLFVLALVVGGIGWVASRLYFEQLWPQIDAILGGRLSGSIFHTLSRDQVIAEVLSTNLIVVAGLAVAALWALLQKKWGLLAMIIMLDMFYNTQGMLFFVPSSVYPTQEQVAQQLTHTTQAPFSALIEPTARVLTRNSNKPYTAFDSYWEAMVVRAPFSDSFVDRYELITGQHAIRLRDGLTPDWNMVYQVPMVHGYTTMLPQDYTAFWQRSETTEVGVNFLDSIELDNPLLSQWAVKYYLVDTWFEVSAEEQQELQALSLVAESQTWQLYELPALSRFRYENNEEVEILHLNEHPTMVDVTFVNLDPERKQLVLADRFENGWRAWVNGQEVAIENYQGMRQVPISQGENKVIFEYQPVTFYSGVATTAVTAGILGVSSWWLSRKRPKPGRSSKISRK